MDIKWYANDNSCRRSMYVKLTKRQLLKPDTKVQPRNDWSREKVKQLEATVNAISDNNDTQHSQMIFKKLAKKYGYLFLVLEDMPLTAAECVSIRDWVGTVTNGLYRLKQAFETFRPELKGLLLPNIRKLMSEKEKEGVVPVKVVEVNCTITKKGDRRGMYVPIFLCTRPKASHS